MAQTQLPGKQIGPLDLATEVTGTLPVANGGTGNATNSANAVLLGNGTGALQTVAPGTAKNVLASDGSTFASTALDGSYLGSTFVGEVFDAQKTQANTTLLASNDFTVLGSLEIAAAHSVEVPSTSTLEILRYLTATSTDTLTNKTIPVASVTPMPGMLAPVHGHTDGNETYTIASGTVTQISGTSIHSGTYSPAIGDRILIATAPASSGAGAGSGSTTQPGNGVYTVTSNTTNLSLSRATDMSDAVNPAGLSVFSGNSSLVWNPLDVWTVTTPSTAAAFTYGTGSIKWDVTGGRNPSITQIFLGNTSGQVGMWNGTGTTRLGSAASAGDQTLTLPAPATDTLVSRTSTDTLTNKTLTDPVIAHVNDPNGNRILSFDYVPSAVNFIEIDDSATGNDPIIWGYGTDTNVGIRLKCKGSGVVKANNDGTDREVATISGGQTLTNKSLDDSTVAFIDNSDTSKKAQFECSGITTATTRIYTLPDSDGLLPAHILCRLDSSYTLANNANVQKLFNSSANGRVTLPSGTYRFRCLYSLSSMSGTSGNSAFSLAVGTAVIGTILMQTVGIDGATATAATQTGSTAVTSAFPASQHTAGTATTQQSFIEGTFEVTTAGTVIPSIQLVTAAAAVVAAGSFFECWRIGSTTVTTVGAWD